MDILLKYFITVPNVNAIAYIFSRIKSRCIRKEALFYWKFSFNCTLHLTRQNYSHSSVAAIECLWVHMICWQKFNFLIFTNVKMRIQIIQYLEVNWKENSREINFKFKKPWYVKKIAMEIAVESSSMFYLHGFTELGMAFAVECHFCLLWVISKSKHRKTCME